jgi:hypothetical protein
MDVMKREPESVETLQGALEDLVRQRQDLRAHGVGPVELERNRATIVRRQRELAAALIARYSHQPAA